MRRPGSPTRRLALLTLATLATAPVTAQTTALPMVVRPEGRVTSSTFGTTGAAAQRDRNGHYYFSVLVDGRPVRMMFDTGASMIALRAEDAARLGIDVAALSYSITMHTANGITQAAPVTLAAITIGGITRRNVQATVARPGTLTENLLGQSFLSRLAGYRQEASQLVLLDRE